ncbi:MAG: aspartate carbamoyltransferase catalytic subunit [Bdellovibrionales bacterium]|nr:aspartate carbamoyltransferase catalytic subunit [Bdellovibrionales bacterium]
MKHLITCKELNATDIEAIFAHASEFKRMKGLTPVSQKQFLNQTVSLIFVESSTRTRMSFEIASLNLGARVVQLFPEISSLNKGETLEDTVLDLYAMGCRYFVIRHPQSGIFDALLNIKKPGLKYINAGDGDREHPSQALLDAFTLIEKFGTLKDLRICILGDVLRSRVAKSNAIVLSRLGAKISVSGPKPLLPSKSDLPEVEIFESPDDAVRDVDVVMGLRTQMERGGTTFKPDSSYLDTYGVSKMRLKLAKKDAWVMHPGPVQRNVDIDSEIIDGPNSLILKQIENGVFVRMAIMAHMGLEMV